MEKIEIDIEDLRVISLPTSSGLGIMGEGEVLNFGSEDPKSYIKDHILDELTDISLSNTSVASRKMNKKEIISFNDALAKVNLIAENLEGHLLVKLIDQDF